MKICVYCASSTRIHSIYFQATRELAQIFLQEEVEIVYGGGSTGLMGTLADEMIEGKGKIRGIMPRFMNEVEWAHKRLEDLHLTDTMHERKAKLLQRVDAVVALAGGTGTFEELMEAMSLKRLGQIKCPIVILNTRNYYEPLKALLQKSIEEHFMIAEDAEMWTFVDEPHQILPAIREAMRKKIDQDHSRFDRYR